MHVTDQPDLPKVEGDVPGISEIARVFDPARLTQARIIAGFTRRELAERLGVSGAALGQYESGAMKPREQVVSLLAGTLHVPVQFFAVGRPLIQLNPRCVSFANARSSRAKARAYSSVYAEQLWELTYALGKRVRLPEPDLPILSPDSTPEQAAHLLRNAWELSGPVRNLVAVAEARGVVVNLAREDDEHIIEAGSFSTPSQSRPIIVIAPQRYTSVYRLRYACAQQLGHLLLHPAPSPGDKSEEDEAARFAVELLSPRHEISPLLPSTIKFAALERLSTEWGVSVRYLVRRMGQLGIASESAVRTAYQRLDAVLGLRRVEPITMHPGEVPSLLSKALALAIQHGASEDALAAELCWDRTRIPMLLNEIDQRPVLQL